MKYEDFEKEFITILKIVAENPEKFDTDMFTTFEELMMITNETYDCWMHPEFQNGIEGASFFALTLKKKDFSYFYFYYTNEKDRHKCMPADRKRCNIINTPREIYNNYPNPEELITVMNQRVVEKI